MDNRPPDKTEAEIIERLKSLPLQEVPPDLTAMVMAEISLSRKSFLQSIWIGISQTYTIAFRPFYAFSLLLIICGAFFIGRYSQPTATVSTDTAELQPGMIEAPQSAYLVGRGLLQADDSHEQALGFLQRASILEPENPDYAYWEGVAHWANGNHELERQSYLRGLEANPGHVPLLINLGHHYLGEKQYQEALDAYRAVLASRPAQPAALYNSGLIYRALGMNTNEISSWHAYLGHHRQGSKAFRALKRLNDYGDYTFRSYRIGAKRMIVNQQKLLDDSETVESQVAELTGIAAVLEQNQSLYLEIVVFIENDRESARARALNMKQMISSLTTAEADKRIGLSWFDVPETIRTSDTGYGIMLSEGLLLFTHLAQEKERERSI